MKAWREELLKVGTRIENKDEAPLVVIRGAGDLATGVAHRLHRSGFRVVMTELAEPLAIRRTVSFSEAVARGSVEVEGISARRAASVLETLKILRTGAIPVLVDPDGSLIPQLGPDVLVDVRMAKRNLGTRLSDAPVVIGLGPGFTAGEDVHAVIETNRGHNLGRVILKGRAEPDTGVPGEIAGRSAERVVRAVASGRFTPRREIGETVRAGEVLGDIDGWAVTAPIDGTLRGLIRDGTLVTAGLKIGDVDPRAAREHCFTISDKARAIGGAVLEAILFFRTLFRRGQMDLGAQRFRRRNAVGSRRRLEP